MTCKRLLQCVSAVLLVARTYPVAACCFRHVGLLGCFSWFRTLFFRVMDVNMTCEKGCCHMFPMCMYYEPVKVWSALFLTRRWTVAMFQLIAEFQRLGSVIVYASLTSWSVKCAAYDTQVTDCNVSADRRVPETGFSDRVRQLQPADCVHQEAAAAGCPVLCGVHHQLHPLAPALPPHRHLLRPVLGVPHVARPGQICLAFTSCGHCPIPERSSV